MAVPRQERQHDFLQGELYEGGVNLSNPRPRGRVLLERRGRDPLVDVGDGDAEGLRPRPVRPVLRRVLSTQASAGVTEETSVAPGTPVTDLAVVQGQGTGTPPTPTGSVTFSICGPTATDSTALCTTGGTQVGSPVALVDSSPPAGEASATSAAVNTPLSPLAPGRYCFRADWPGDANYVGALTHAGTTTECFIVRQIPTATVTTPSDGSGVALTSPVPLGTTIFDRAVVTGTSVGGTPTGTVDFFLCNPSQVTGARRLGDLPDVGQVLAVG